MSYFCDLGLINNIYCIDPIKLFEHSTHMETCGFRGSPNTVQETQLSDCGIPNLGKLWGGRNAEWGGKGEENGWEVSGCSDMVNKNISTLIQFKWFLLTSKVIFQSGTSLRKKCTRIKISSIEKLMHSCSPRWFKARSPQTKQSKWYYHFIP